LECYNTRSENWTIRDQKNETIHDEENEMTKLIRPLLAQYLAKKRDSFNSDGKVRERRWKQ